MYVSLKMTHKETKHVGYIMFQVLKFELSLAVHLVGNYETQYIVCTLFAHY